MKNSINNAIMIFIAITAIAAVLAFMVSLGEITYKKTDSVTTAALEETTTAVCEHITNSKCVCTLCGETVHDWDSGSANDCQQQSICFTCEAVGGPVGPHTDWNDDNKCDLCDTIM